MNDETLKKIIAKRKCEKSLLFFTRYFFKQNKKQKYVVKPFVETMASKLQDVAEGKIKRLIINIPPRMGKTELAVINYMAWVIANNPEAKFIHLSYSDSLALDNSSKCKELVLSEEYQQFWKRELKDDGKSKKKWYTKEGGGVYATSAGGEVTGFGAGNIEATPFCGAIIIDDPLKADDANSDIERNKVNERFFNTILSRLNNENVPIIIIMQRLHEDDLSGHLLAKEGHIWQHLKIPIFENNISIWEEKLSTATLLQQQKSNPRIFAGQYLQEPAPIEGNLWKEDWLQWYDGKNRFTEIYQSWDTAVKTGTQNDYSVCTTWGVSANQFYLLDFYMDKLEYPQLKEAIISQADKFKPRQIIVEDKASGSGILQSLRQETNLPIVAVAPDKDKITRFIMSVIHFEARRVYFPKSLFLDEMIMQLKTFPNAKHDDIVDSISQFLNWYNLKPKADVFVF